jgi:hypothetical protein
MPASANAKFTYHDFVIHGDAFFDGRVSLSERQSGSACPTMRSQMVDLSYSMLHAPRPMLRHDQVMRRSSWSCCKWG